MATRRRFDDGPDGGTDVLDRTEAKPRPKRPRMHKVVLHNDNHSMPDNVASVVAEVFSLSHEKAWDVMMEAHTKDRAICGLYTCEVAETKVLEATHAGEVLGERIVFTHEPD